jgi:hypothetical protein
MLTSVSGRLFKILYSNVFYGTSVEIRKINVLESVCLLFLLIFLSNEMFKEYPGKLVSMTLKFIMTHNFS